MVTTSEDESEGPSEEIGSPLAPSVQALADAEEEVGAPDVPTLQPFDPEPERERVRSRLAHILIGYVVFISTVLMFAVLFKVSTVNDAKELASLFITPALALTGAAIAFYYAGKGR